MSDWHVRSIDPIYNTEEPPEVIGQLLTAVNNKTGELFVGSPDEYNNYSSGLPLDTGNVSKTGAGTVCTTQKVAHCSYHRLVNTHGSEALTLDVSFDDGTSWATGMEFELQDGTYVASLPAGKFGILRGKFDKLRLACADDASGRITSYTSSQV